MTSGPATGCGGRVGRPPARPVLTWVPSEDLTGLDVAMTWHELVTRSSPRATCVWTTRPVERQRIDHPAFDELCWHVVDLPARLDRHLPDADGRAPWSPWGSKSGPNHQFFTVLDAQRVHHLDDWVLFIEPDTHPLCDDVADRIGGLIDGHRDAWMIGGLPHTSVRPFLASDLWHHVNGAALYHAASDDFARFRSMVWIPALLLRIRTEPKYAFDCVTDPAQWEYLPGPLRKSWKEAAGRFVRTAGVVNLSPLTLSSDQALRLLEDIRWRHECDDDHEPWMLHVKGDLVGIRQMLTSATRSEGGT